MFPNYDERDIQERLEVKGFELALQSLLDSSELNTSSVTNVSLDTLLMMHSEEMIDASRDTFLTLNRQELWQRATCFYKATKNSPEKLGRNLVVVLEEEEGIDAGALRGYFFEQLLKEVNERLFEGDIFRRVPKKDSELDCYFELAGRMVAHSVLQGGPSLDCLCPAVVATLLSGGGIESAIEEIMVEDIPLNAGTVELIAFIHEVSMNYCTVLQICPP